MPGGIRRHTISAILKFVPVVTAPALPLRGPKVAQHFPDREHKERHRHQNYPGACRRRWPHYNPRNTARQYPRVAAMLQARQTLLLLAELSSASQVA